MTQSWEQYYDSQEQEAAGAFMESVRKAVLALNQGRNLRCFPVLSFGWKDADLGPEGCTGVKELISVSDTEAEIVVGGHKTVCPPEDETRMDVAQEVVNGAACSAEWDGENWILSFSDTLTVPAEWNDDETDLENIARIALAVVNAARDRCNAFEQEAASIHNAVAELDNEATDAAQ